jgi:hypothetical protein
MRLHLAPGSLLVAALLTVLTTAPAQATARPQSTDLLRTCVAVGEAGGGSWTCDSAGLETKQKDGTAKFTPAAKLSEARVAMSPSVVIPQSPSNGGISHRYASKYIEYTGAKVIFGEGTILEGSYNVKLTTNLSGRTPRYSVQVLNFDTPQPVSFVNMYVGCTEDSWIGIPCGQFDVPNHYTATTWSWGPKTGNRLVDGDPYHSYFDSEVQWDGDPVPVGTLSSSQFSCPSNPNNSTAAKYNCYFPEY